MAAGAAATVLPWLVFATLRFGSPVPHNLKVKLQAFDHYEAYPAATLKMLLVEVPELFGRHSLDRSRVGRSARSAHPAVPAAAAGALALAAAFAARRRQSLLITGTLLLYLLFHGAGNKLCFGWYGVPLIPLLLAVLPGGFHTVWLRLFRGADVRGAPAANLATGLCAALLLAANPPSAGAPDARYNVLVRGDPDREPNYRAAAELLNSRSAKPDAVAVPGGVALGAAPGGFRADGRRTHDPAGQGAGGNPSRRPAGTRHAVLALAASLKCPALHSGRPNRLAACHLALTQHA